MLPDEAMVNLVTSWYQLFLLTLGMRNIRSNLYPRSDSQKGTKFCNFSTPTRTPEVGFGLYPATKHARICHRRLLKSETDPAIVGEFRKGGVLQKLNSTFFDASLKNDSLPIDKVSAYVSEAPTGNRNMSQVYKMIMINTTQPEFQRWDRFYCDFVTLMGLMHELFQYDVRLMGEMVKIPRRLIASGLVHYWDQNFRHYRFFKLRNNLIRKPKLDTRNESAEDILRKLLIQIYTLEMILVISAVCMGLSSLGFLLHEVKLYKILKDLISRTRYVCTL